MGTRLHSNSGDNGRIAGLIASAKQSARRGRLHEAERLARQAEMEAPRHPLVLNENAGRLLQSGDAAAAVAILESLVQVETGNSEIWFNYAAALRKVGRIGEAAATLDKILEAEPRNVVALLEKGSLAEALDQPRSAAMSYRAALQLIPPGSTVPREFEAALRRAQGAVDANNRALEIYVEDGLAEIKSRFSKDASRRFDQCVDILLQKRSVYRQQPTFMYFPELPTIEFYERGFFPWLEDLEAATADIRAELLEVMSDGDQSLVPYVTLPKGAPVDLWRELNHSRKWSCYSFWLEGRAYPDHLARCPRTAKALKNWPKWDVPGSGPTAMFSILEAKTRIPPHTGPVNTRLVVHLPLIVPPACGFRVGGQQREWVEGQAFVFDDSINHEAWNDSDVPRAILIVDTWSPYLSEVERELVRTFTRYVGEYYGTFSNSNGVDLPTEHVSSPPAGRA
jgi:aspartate beta-hydroxylase